jgi:hypothetical protein
MRRLHSLLWLALLPACATSPQAVDTAPAWPARQPITQEDCPQGARLHKDNLALTCQDAQGSPHGPFRLMDAQGNILRAGRWAGGLPSGRWQFWSPQGALLAQKGFDDQGRLHGLVRLWGADGALHTELVYEHGHPWRGFTTSPGLEGAPVTHHYEDGERLPLAPLPPGQ